MCMFICMCGVYTEERKQFYFYCLCNPIACAWTEFARSARRCGRGMRKFIYLQTNPLIGWLYYTTRINSFRRRRVDWWTADGRGWRIILSCIYTRWGWQRGSRGTCSEAKRGLRWQMRIKQTDSARAPDRWETTMHRVKGPLEGDGMARRGEEGWKD